MDLIRVWDDYYSQSQEDTVLKDKNFFELEVNALTSEIAMVSEGKGAAEIRILEVGSGTGYLAKRILEKLGERTAGPVSFTGIDFSEIACAKARERDLPGARFVAEDFVRALEADATKYDFIVSQRSIMAIMDEAGQQRLLTLIREHLAPGGVGVLSEGSKEALDLLGKMRAELGVDEAFEKVWHSRYLERRQIESVFPRVTVVDYASTYWLITRVLYPYFEKPKHNTKLHDFAATLPQLGDYGLVKLFLVRAA